MSHQFCPPRLVLPVEGRVRGVGGGGLGEAGCQSNRADLDQ